MSNEKLHNNDFLKNTLALLSGTAGAHLITLIALPFLQRYFYSAADFANFAWFNEFVLIFVTVSALRLETGIVLEKEERQARILTNVSLKLVILVSLVGLLTAVIGSFFISTFQLVFKEPWMFLLIPISIGTLGIIQVLSSWYTRNESFKFLAGSKLYQTSSTTLSQVGFGLIKFAHSGLIIGKSIGTSVVSLILLKRYWKLSTDIEKGTKKEKRDLIRKNRDFILYTMPSTFLGTFINFIFINLFIRYYGEDLTGILATSKLYLGMGLGLISSAFSQVFYSQIAKIDDVSHLKKYYTYWLKRLVIIALSVLVVVSIIPNSWIIVILGEEWDQLIPVTRVMAIWIGILFVSSSLSYIYIKLNRQITLIYFDLFNLSLTFGSIILSYYLYQDFWISLYWFTTAKGFYYLFAIFATYYFFKNPVAKKNH